MRQLFFDRVSGRFLVSAVISALVAGIAGLAPAVLSLEEALGLDWLLKLRGPVSSPDDVVIVAMNKPSAHQLGVSGAPGEWPRRLHTQLVDTLTTAGVKTIAFDVLFRHPREHDEDLALGRSLARHGHVVLFEKIEKDTLDSHGSVSPGDDVVIEKLIPPISDIGGQARALAPFPLPHVPLKVSQFWKFVPGAADAPTLPVLALLIHLRDYYPLYRDIVASVDARLIRHLPENKAQLDSQNIAAFMKAHRQDYIANPDLSGKLDQAVQQHTNLSRDERRAVRALIAAFSGNASEYLNFYGPPLTITTLPYHEVLSGLHNQQLSGKAVFVGASAFYQWEQYDGFYTAFSQADGLDLSGVEIAATAFANMLRQQTIHPLSASTQFIVISLWGMLLCLLCAWRSAVFAALSSCIAAGGFLAVNVYLFTSYYLWLPVVLPLLLQWPLTLLAFIIWRNSKINREKRNIIQSFGHYLPKKEVQRLARSAAGPDSGGQLVFGICLFTDAQQYTRLSEQLAPEQLTELINQYYAVLFEPVRHYGGIVSDIKGDSMLAIWSATQNTARLRLQACRCALTLISDIERFNHSHNNHPLPTRIGVHCGDIMLGHVGAGHHYEYRAVGDIVNTASRIEGLNKHLGTRLLVSSEMIDGLAGLASRELGTFQLAGKTRATTLHELVGLSDDINMQQASLNSAFAAALQHFRQRQWPQALTEFTRIASQSPGDRAAQFYIKLCQIYCEQPPDQDWDGIVTMAQK